MLLFRVCTTKYAGDLSGDGAKINAGRWNHAGTPCIYCSATRALALLEYTTHANIHLIPRALSFVTFEVPADSLEIFSVANLPGNWKHFPHPKETRDFGTTFLTNNKFLLYQIPSVVIEEEMNFVVNPSHPEMKSVKIQDIRDYSYDLRLKSN